jgi:hypothetical protein
MPARESIAWSLWSAGRSAACARTWELGSGPGTSIATKRCTRAFLHNEEARGRLRAWREEQLLTRKHVKGIIFDLENNYGCRQKHQVEWGPRAVKAMAAAG